MNIMMLSTASETFLKTKVCKEGFQYKIYNLSIYISINEVVSKSKVSGLTNFN